jgi:hypothetical protein
VARHVVETRNSKSDMLFSKSSACRGQGNAKEGLQEESGARMTRDMDRAVNNTRQCVLGTRERLSEVGIIEVQGSTRGFSEHKGDGLDGGDEIGDKLMGGRPSGSGVSDYTHCCVSNVKLTQILQYVL